MQQENDDEPPIVLALAGVLASGGAMAPDWASHQPLDPEITAENEARHVRAERKPGASAYARRRDRADH